MTKETVEIEVVEKNKKDLGSVVKEIMSNPETSQQMTQLMQEGIHGIFSGFISMAQEVADNNAKKYEEQAKVYIATLEEETKRELASLEQLSKDSHEYYMQFKETRDAYYKELEDLRKMIVNEENSVVRMRYCDLYEKAQRALDKNLKNLGEHMNQTIKGSKKKRGFLEKITSHFTPSSQQ